MADVSATLAGWSSTTASNSPAGSTSIGTGLDDNLRELQGVVVRGLSHKGADIASAGTTDIGAIEGLMHDITGTTTITGLGTVRAGIWKVLKFEGAVPVIHNGTSNILPGAANITTADGDVAVVMSEGSGNWRWLHYQRAIQSPDRTVIGTPVSLSSTSTDISGIPTGIRRFNLILNPLSFDNTAAPRVQIGPAAGVESANYSGTITTCVATATATASASGIDFLSGTAAGTYIVHISGVLIDPATNKWSFSITGARTDSGDSFVGVVTKALAGPLSVVRVTSVAGTASFDGTSVANYSYGG